MSDIGLPPCECDQRGHIFNAHRTCQWCHRPRIALEHEWMQLEIEQLRAELEERTLQHRTQLDNAVRLEREAELLRTEAEEARRWEAVCHCGLELSRHSELTEHVATEATVPCPNEDALKAALAVLQEIAAKAAYQGDDDYFQIASMGIKQ